MPNFIEIGEFTWEKSGTKIVYTHEYFGFPGDPRGPKVTGLGGGVHQSPSSYLQNFVPLRRPLSEISAAKLRRFCCRRDPQKIYSKRCLRLTCGDKNSLTKLIAVEMRPSSYYINLYSPGRKQDVLNYATPVERNNYSNGPRTKAD